MKGRVRVPRNTRQTAEFTQEEQVKQLLSKPQIDHSERDHKIRTEGNAGTR